MGAGVFGGHNDHSRSSLLHVHVGDADDIDGGFVSIQEAVLAASDGDRIVIDGGDYDEIVHIQTGRSVSLVAEEGATVRLRGLSIEGLPANKIVAIRGLHTVLDQNYPRGIGVRNSKGSIWMEDCSTDAHGSLVGLDMLDSESVVLIRCKIRGGVALIRSGTSFIDCDVEAVSDVAGIDAMDSSVIIQGGRVTGAPGRNAGSRNGAFVEATCGQPGLRVWGTTGNSETTISDAEFIGGQGGEGLDEGSRAPDGEPTTIAEGSGRGGARASG